jgi:hypothetical protein
VHGSRFFARHPHESIIDPRRLGGQRQSQRRID